MSKPAIDELLDTVSQGDIDHPIFGSRYSGDMDNDEFILEVNDYVLSLQNEVEFLKTQLRVIDYE